MEDRARLRGERGLYVRIGSSDGESEYDPAPSIGTSGDGDRTLGGRRGK